MRLDDVLAIVEALEAEGVRYAVFGGMAMAVHGLDRATRDLDLFVAADADNVGRLRNALRRLFHDVAIDEITAEDLAGAYPAIQYGPPDVDYTIDLVSRLGDAFVFEDLEIERHDLDGVPVHVVSPSTLYRMKRDTVRPHDRLDARTDAPVRKYRRIEDMPGPPPAGSPLEGLASACALAALCAALAPSGVAERGVRKFRSVEEADAHRQAWEVGPIRLGGESLDEAALDAERPGASADAEPHRAP